MGSPEGELGRWDREVQHEVTLTKGFWLLEHEVTQEMWESVMGTKPSYFKGPKLPVENVSWDDCQDFIKKIQSFVSVGMQFSLPSEAQWEYACRAGTRSALNNGKELTDEKYNCPNLNEVAWYGSNSESTTHEVKGKKPNNWGLYDMHGNVWEWCNDWYGEDYYKKSPTTDPLGPSDGSSRVGRGGGWDDGARLCRSAFRSNLSPENRYYILGFRLALSPQADR